MSLIRSNTRHFSLRWKSDGLSKPKLKPTNDQQHSISCARNGHDAASQYCLLRRGYAVESYFMGEARVQLGIVRQGEYHSKHTRQNQELVCVCDGHAGLLRRQQDSNGIRVWTVVHSAH